MSDGIYVEKYVELQGRIRNGKLHIQGKGTKINRSYGIAVDIAVPAKLVQWFSNQEHTLPSLAGSDAVYVPLRAFPEGEEIVRVEAIGTPFNTEEGISFKIKSSKLYDFVSQMAEKHAEEYTVMEDNHAYF